MGINIGIGASVGNRRYGRSVEDENERISDIGDDISDIGDDISEHIGDNHEGKEEEASLPEVRRQRHQELINKLLR